MLALILPLVLAACDLGTEFANPAAWSVSASEFVARHSADGFVFASQRQDVANCMKRGGCTWNGLEVWESRVYCSTAGISKVEMSLYNRGDDKEDGLDSAELGELLESIASKAEPKGKMGGNPQKHKLRNGGFRFSKRWTNGPVNVDFAWGTDGVKAKDLTADYVRVVMTPKGSSRPKGVDQAMRSVVSKSKIRTNVTRNGEGDVWIDNVPMVDQGQKGYCAAATSERILRYYGFDIDEHEIAQSAGTTAGGGTSVSDMRETVRSIGSKCRLGFQSVVSMSGSIEDIEKGIESYNKAAKSEGARELSMAEFVRGNVVSVPAIAAAMLPEVVLKSRLKDARFKRFLKGVTTQVNQGIPLFWGVTLGMFPEPGLPQASGGHMRLIVGYNSKTHEILFTDTWGAGHELKRMPEDKAFAITHDVFFLKPL